MVFNVILVGGKPPKSPGYSILALVALSRIGKSAKVAKNENIFQVHEPIPSILTQIRLVRYTTSFYCYLMLFRCYNREKGAQKSLYALLPILEKAAYAKIE